MKTIFFILILFCTSLICTSSVIVSGGTDNDIAGRMCRTPDGKLIAIIERNPDWGSGDFYSTLSDDNGNTWSALNPVVTQSGNQSSHTVICSNDTIILFYASDESGSYKIYSIESVDGINWINKEVIDLGWSASQNVYDPIVIVEDDGSLTMSYISMGNGAYAAHCPSEASWDTDKNQIIGGAYRARICKHSDGTYMAAYHRNISGNYDIHVRTSTDLISWTDEVDITSNGNSHDAYCSISPDGFYYLYYAKNTSGVYNLCRKTSSDGINWSNEEAITSDNTSNTQPSLFFEENLLHLMWTHAIDYDTDNDVYYENFSLTTNSENLLSPSDFDLFSYSNNNNLVIDLQDNNCDTYRLTVISITGQVLYNGLHNANEGKVTLMSIPAGMYIVRAETKKASRTIKAIVR